VRNLLNFKNVIQVFAVNGDVRNNDERAANLKADLDDLASERDINNAVGPDGAIDLSFGGAADPRAGCNNWVSTKQAPAAANCVYLIRAEERYGNGDHVYTIDEQTRAVNALYDVGRGTQEQYGAPRRARLGFEVNF
jgi:hypothetical protein